MRIHTNVLTEDNLRAALPKGVTLHELSRHGSRSHARAFNCYLSGSGKMGGQWGNCDRKSATWTEYGRWMAELFIIDPQAKIANYDGIADFAYQTEEACNRWLRDREDYANGRQSWNPRAVYDARPWLDDTELAGRFIAVLRDWQ